MSDFVGNAARAVIVTGASSGIGACMARFLGEAGFTLYLVGRSVEGLRATARIVAEFGGPDAQYQVLDIAEPGKLATYVTQVAADHPYLFALINNAGIMHPEALITGRPERWRAMMDVNYLAPLEACVAAIGAMRRHGKPAHLINVSSLAAEMAEYGAYSASKAALEMVSRTLRNELEHDDIRITTLVPGGFATNLARDFPPETLAGMVEAARAKGIDLTSGPDERLLGDPAHLARAVLYVLAQPTSVNIERLVVRPPIDL